MYCPLQVQRAGTKWGGKCHWKSFPSCDESKNRNLHKISQFANCPPSVRSQNTPSIAALFLHWELASPGLTLVSKMNWNINGSDYIERNQDKWNKWLNVLPAGCENFQVSQYPKLSRADFSDTIVCEIYLQTLAQNTEKKPTKYQQKIQTNLGGKWKEDFSDTIVWERYLQASAIGKQPRQYSNKSRKYSKKSRKYSIKSRKYSKRVKKIPNKNTQNFWGKI